MMKKILLALSVFIGMNAIAQEESVDTLKLWKSGASTSLSFSQVSLTNWAGGGNSSLAGTFFFKGFVNYAKDKIAWDNTIDLGYGLTQREDENIAKSEDKFQFTTKLGYENGKNWFYTALLDLKTQMDVGYKDPVVQDVRVSDIMAPGYVQFSIGMDHKPSDNFSLYISPITSKFTFVLDEKLADAGAYGVDPGESVRSELGASVKVLAKKNDIVKNVNAYTRLDLFTNYSENPENIDVDFELGFEMKVNKYLNAIFKTNLVYDDDIKTTNDAGQIFGPKLQTKQLFGAGLSYSF